MNDFVKALLATGKAAYIPEEDNLFGWLVGAWDFIWQDNKSANGPRQVKGEWIFSWIIEGQSMQDVFICPARGERDTNPQPDAAYGTTIRTYNPQRRIWHVYYVGSGDMSILEARREGGDIVLACLNCQGVMMKWQFSEMKTNSFRWQNFMSFDNGQNWQLEGELLATRRGQ